MIVKFWGVRGSYPTSRAGVLRYGGNTSCVSVQIGSKLLVLDAGSGVVQLGEQLDDQITDIYFLLTHLHRDHIDGFPFFNPLYESRHHIHLIDYQRGNKFWTLVSMLDGVYYPMRPSSLKARYNRVGQGGLDYLREQGFDIRRIRMNHPGGAFGYKVVHEGKSFVYMPDNELIPQNPCIAFEEFVAFCERADLLAHDAMYVASEMPAKMGWGHSSVVQACELARAARVKHLVLTHHAPERDDEVIDSLQSRSKDSLSLQNIACTAAFEGLTVSL